MEKRLNLRHAGIVMLALVAGSISGCSILDAPPTSQVIYITATPAPAIDTLSPTPGATDVIAAALDASATLPALPTFPPGTDTPAATRPNTLTPTFTLTPTDTPAPNQPTGVAKRCSGSPQGGFATIYGRDAALQKSLGCAVESAVAITSDSQSFESGKMVWASQFGSQATRMIYTVYNNGTYQRYSDTWAQGVDPESTGETAPAGRTTPIRGFGKVWHNNALVKSGLGWATNGEAGTPGQIQRFEHGEMLFVASLGQTFIFVSGSSNTWRADSTPF